MNATNLQRTCLGAVLLPMFLLVNAPAAAEEGGLRESPSQPGVFFHLDAPAATFATTNPRGGQAPVTPIPGFLNPGPVVRDGNLLYVGINEVDTIGVVDISVYGAEAKIDEFAAPVCPVDIAVADGSVYVINQEHSPLYYRPLDGDTWSSIDLPNAGFAEWVYGDIIYPYPLGNKMLVVHIWEDLIDVVNLDTGTVEQTIDELEYCPYRVVFTEDRMIVLGVCTLGPSCGATGPNYSVFDLATFEKIDQRDISGLCPLALVELNGIVYVVFDGAIKSYDLETGAELATLYGILLSRHAVTDGTSIIVQRYDGLVRKIDADLAGFGEFANVLDGPAGWSPPVEEMLALDATDGRLFVTNRDDNALSVVYFTPQETPCDGDVNGDGMVDPLDSGYVLSRFGCSVGSGDPDCDAADANTDGLVDPLDAGYVLSRLGACS